MIPLFARAFIYGCIGLIVEVIFTGIGSVVNGNLNATSTSYLWMLPIYGITALALEAIAKAVKWPFYLKAFLYVPIIFGVEALSGWTIQQLIGTIPWDYTHTAWSPMGLINLRYAPFWLLLGMLFEPMWIFLNHYSFTKQIRNNIPIQINNDHQNH